MPNWPEYIKQTENKSTRPLLVEALDYVSNKDTALDLGAGALNDSKYLILLGFKVIAVDGEELVKIDSDKFVFNKTKIEAYNFPENTFDLVSAQFVLPFIKREDISRILSDIKKSLKPEGIFTGQFFGDRDSWNKLAHVCVFNNEEVKELLNDFEEILIREEERDGKIASGETKHWHIFHFIVKNKIN